MYIYVYIHENRSTYTKLTAEHPLKYFKIVELDDNLSIFEVS